MSSESKIRVEMVCGCGNTAEPDTGGYGSRSGKGAIVLHNYLTYICAKCGKTMSHRIVKKVTTETETVL